MIKKERHGGDRNIVVNRDKISKKEVNVARQLNNLSSASLQA
jgi:hypothetical protein